VKQGRLDYLEEGRKIREMQKVEKENLEQIKGEKLSDLKGLGISDKYMADLSRKKIN
jgi:hypothetical protein